MVGLCSPAMLSPPTAVCVATPRRRGLLPPGLPRAHYRYRTTIISGPPVPYDARPYAYGRYGYAPYINSYGIPAAVIVDPVDPAYLWRQPYPYGSPLNATPYSCLFYNDC